MSNVKAQDAALNYILGLYADQLDALKPAKEVPGKAPKAKLSTSHRKPKAPKSEVKVYHPTFAYEACSVGPEGFFKLLRSARSRTEEIDAINAYVGFSHHENFGTQLDAARRKGQLALHSHLGHRSAKSTVAGYVAGTPDNVKRDVQNLLARERGAADSLCSLQVQLSEVLSKLSDPYLSNATQDDLQSQRNLVQGLIAVENDRIANIRADLAKLESL